jgi:hypothetical protein
MPKTNILIIFFYISLKSPSRATDTIKLNTPLTIAVDYVVSASRFLSCVGTSLKEPNAFAGAITRSGH